MISINKKTLDCEIVCGDTGTFSFELKDKNTGENFLRDGDELWFTLRKIQDEEIILQKVIKEFENGVITIPISPEETASIEPDNYMYDMKLIRADGNVDTLIPNRPYAYFTLKRGVK